MVSTSGNGEIYTYEIPSDTDSDLMNRREIEKIEGMDGKRG